MPLAQTDIIAAAETMDDFDHAHHQHLQDHHHSLHATGGGSGGSSLVGPVIVAVVLLIVLFVVMASNGGRGSRPGTTITMPDGRRIRVEGDGGGLIPKFELPEKELEQAIEAAERAKSANEVGRDAPKPNGR